MKNYTSLHTLLIFVVLFLFQSFDGKAATYTTSQSGAWNVASTWGGAGVPTATDDAIITGGVTVTIVQSEQCRNLLIDANSSNTITYSSTGLIPSLTINGTMGGWNVAGGAFSWPIVGSQIIPWFGLGSISFTGSNITGIGRTIDVIYTWNNTNNINVDVDFNLVGTRNIDNIFSFSPPSIGPSSMDFNANVTISNGILQNGPGPINGFNVASTLNISNGTLTTSVYVNSNIFNIGSTGTLNTSYSGTQGWWSGSNVPGTFSIDPASTIHYSASAVQNVWARQYGNLQLSNGTKMETGGGAMVIKGNLSNSGTWSPTQVITFSGTGSQLISGGTIFSGGIIFGGGGSNSVSILQDLDLVATDMLINTNSTFTPGSKNVTLSGDLTNDGTYTAGTGSVIFNGATTILGGTTTTFNDIIISGTLNGSTSTFNVSGSFTNNGTFNKGNSEVVFTGSGIIGGSASTSFYDLTISNTNPQVVNIESDVNLYNVLTLNSNGHIDADGTGTGSLTLVSEDNGTAKIGPIGDGGVFDGNITMQRRIVPGTTGWRFISTPLKNQTLASWTDDFSVQGVIGGTFPNGDPITFSYNEPAGTALNVSEGWQEFTNITDNISNTGIKVYFFASQLTPTLILDNTGPPVIGAGDDNKVQGTEQYVINIDYTTPGGYEGGGWNLIENPYPCEIDFDNVILSGGLFNVNNGIYIWDPTAGTSGNYTSYVGGVSDGKATQYIASGQSFFVKAFSTGAKISYTEANKNTSNGNTFIREGIIENVIKIKIASDDNSNFNQTAIRFRPSSSESFESEFDAYKLANGWINISSLAGEELDLSINTLGDVKEVQSVRLRVVAWAFGAYKINFSGLESFADNVQFRLVDKYLDETTIVNADAEYAFEILGNSPETYGDERFELQIVQEVNVQGEVATFAGEPVNEVKVEANGEGSITGIDGLYALQLIGESSYSLSASKMDDVKLNEAVTTIDIIKTILHLLQIREFESPYQSVAADVNMSKSITALDLIQMRKVVLGMDDGFSSGVNWLFIPDTYDLSANPFAFEEYVDVDVSGTDVDLDFVAVKIGDVNNSWKNPGNARTENGQVVLSLEHLKLTTDNIVAIPVVVSDFRDISGYQFSITWDANQLEYHSTEHTGLQGEFNEQHTSNGILSTVWYDADGKSVNLDDGDELFVLKFKIKDEQISGVVDINSTLTKAMAFDGELNTLNIHSVSANVNLEDLLYDGFELYQNVPNPFDHTTEISFKITKPGLAKFTIVNLLGEIVFHDEQEYDAGVHSVTWDRSQGTRQIAPGMYLYRLKCNGEEAVKKMTIE